MTYNILVVEDNKAVSDLICSSLSRNELFQVESTDRIKWARKILKKRHFDIVCLDIILPDENGLEFCKEIKSNPNFKNLKVLILSQKTEAISKIDAFEIGADEYLTKPFHPQELEIRIKKHLGLINSTNFKICYRNLSLDINKSIFLFEKYEIPLTPTEFLILRYIFENGGDIKLEALANFLSSRKFTNIDKKSAIVSISRLKRKLKKNTGRYFIKNRYGVGYYLP